MPQKTCLPCCCRQWWQRWQGGHTTHLAIVLWLSQNKIRMIKVKTTWKKGKANSDNWHATKSLPSVLSTATVARRAYHPRRRCPSAFPKQINDDTNHRRQSQNQRQLTPIGKREKQILTINMPLKTCLQSCRRQWWQRWGYRNLMAMDTRW